MIEYESMVSAMSSDEILNQTCRFRGSLDQQGMGRAGDPGEFDGLLLGICFFSPFVPSPRIAPGETRPQ